MSEIDKKIRKGLPPRRDAACLQVTQDIVIPAGTILRVTKGDEYACEVGIGSPVRVALFSVMMQPDKALPLFKRVTAA